LVFVPGLAFEDVEDALASIDVYFDGALETYYVYIPEDPSVGSGYWIEMGIP